MDALGQGILTFTSQNCGSGNIKRIRQMFRIGISAGITLQLILGISCYVFPDTALSVFTNDPEVLYYGKQIMLPICVSAFVNTKMNIPFHIMRGMGYSVFPMVCTLLCVCLLRILWICTVFPVFHTITGLYAAWPVMKGIVSIAATAYYFRIMAKISSYS